MNLKQNILIQLRAMKTLLNCPSIIHDPPHVLEDIIHGHPMPPKHFRHEIDFDGIAWITFDSPKSSVNVWNEETLREFNHLLETIEHDTRVKAVVLRSAKERIFIAGADIKAIRSMQHVRVNDLIWLGQAVFDRLARLKVPKIAAIHGACMGGGFELALGCHFRVATANASIALPEIKLGLIPGAGGTQRLPRAIGKAKAMDMCLSARTLSAEEADRYGLVSRVVPTDALMSATLTLAQQMASYSLPALMAIKESVNRAWESSLSEGILFERRALHARFASADAHEGMHAFLEKRPPAVSHR